MKPQPPSTPSVPTIADLIADLRTDTSVGEAPRTRMTTALRSFCRHLGLPPDGTPAAPALLRDAAAGFSPAAAGITPRTWSNTRSAVLAALRHDGLVPHAARNSHPSPAWDVWRPQMQTAGCDRMLSHLARWSSAHGIGPDEIDDAILDRFHRHLIDETMASRPQKSHQNTCRAWNKVCAAIPGFPGRPVTLPRYRASYRLPTGTLPAGFRADLAAWLDLLAGTDPLDERGPLRPLRPTTLESNEGMVLRFAAAAVHAGTAPADLTALSALVRYDIFKSALGWMIRNNRGKAGPGIVNTALTIYYMAQHYLRLDPERLAELHVLVDRVKVGNERHGLTERNRGRLRQFDDPALVLRLLDLPDRLFREAARRPQSSRSAVLAQTGLMIHLLLMAPIRRQNLVTLRLDRHILRERSRRRGGAHLVLGAAETKNRNPFEAPLPAPLVEHLDVYLARWHPLLTADPDSPWLFPGRDGTHKHPIGVSAQVTKTIERFTGLEVNIHLFRHLAARLNLEARPGAYEDTRRLLGHASVDTTTAYYAGMETAGAVKRYDETVLGLKRRAAPAVDKPAPRRTRRRA